MRLQFVLAACLLISVVAPRTVCGQTEESTDLVLLVLVPADLEDASKTLLIHDPNNDGLIDAEEQKRITWREQVADYDLNKDGKLSHLEVALRMAKQRRESGVLQIDRNFASKHLRRHDRNKNGQLDSAEIALGWPDEPDEFDKNSDGVLTLGEITEMLAFQRRLRKELGIMGVDQGGAAKVVNQFDKNSDRRLDENEWDAAPLPRKPKDFDQDEDGMLSVMEVATMFARHRMDSGMSKSDQFESRRFFALLDRDANGVVTKDEFEKMKSAGSAKIDLATYDTDKNGEVTLADIERYFASARKKKGYADKHAAQAQRLMVRHDQDRSGSIERSELLDEATDGQLSVDLLKKIDLDQDEKITHEELAKHLARQESEK